MSLRTSLILMVVFLVMGYFAFFEPLRTQERDEAQKDRESHVAWLKDKKLEAIQIRGGQPAELECAKKDKACPFDGTGEWVLRKPVQDGADPAAVGTLASSILNLTHNGKVDFDIAPPDEKEFGLDHPKAELTLRFAGEKEPLTFKFGKESAVGPNVYLSVSNDPKHLFLVPNYLPGMINKETFHWVNKRLFAKVEGSSVNRIEWKSAKLGEVRGVRTGDDWRLEKPRALPASKIMFEGLGSTLAFASAKSLLSPDRTNSAAKKALAGSPQLELRFHADDGDHVLKLFSRPSNPNGPREYAAVADSNPAVYLLDAAIFDRFQKDFLEYRQRAPLSDKVRTQVDEAQLKFPREKHEITFKLKDGNWSASGGDAIPGRFEPNRLAGFLDSLRDDDFKAAFAPAAAEAKAFRSQTPDLELTLRAGGKELYRAKFLVFERKRALTEGDGDVLALGESFLKYLPVRLADLSEVANQTVVTKPEKGGPDGHDPQSEQQHRH